MSKEKVTLLLCVAGMALGTGAVGWAAPMGTAFLYQGRLMDGDSPADGEYDFEFKLYDDSGGNGQVGSTVNVENQQVRDGLFTMGLDFGGGVFDGEACWLEIGVRPGASVGGFTTLSPRQKVTPTPYALYAKTAGSDNDWMVSGDDMYSIPSGNVGIGETNPSEKLEVKGNININSVYKIGGSTVLAVPSFGNTLVGIGAGENNTRGDYNTFSGNMAGRLNTSGYRNTFSGYKAGYLNTSGYLNTFSGYNAGYSNTTGNRNSAMGSYALFKNTGNGNSAMGYVALNNNSTGSRIQLSSATVLLSVISRNGFLI